MIKRHLLRLIDKYTTGTASPEERAFLEAWFDALETSPSYCQSLTDEELKKLEQELFDSILKRIEELRYQRFELHNQISGNPSYNPELLREKYIDLIKHPPLKNAPVSPILRPDDVCFRPMLQYLSPNHRQTLTWGQLDKMPLQELAAKLRLTTSGARSRLQRAQEKLTALVRRCCTYQFDNNGYPLSCLITHTPGCCEHSGLTQ